MLVNILLLHLKPGIQFKTRLQKIGKLTCQQSDFLNMCQVKDQFHYV